MKKIVGLFAISIIVLIVIGCPMGSSVQNEVPLLPVVWANPVASGSHALAPESGRYIAIPGSVTSTAEYDCSFSPLVTSFQSNTIGKTAGDTFTSTGPLGKSVTTTISTANSGQDVVFDGKFNDDNHANGYGHYKVTHHKNKKSFDYEETVIYQITDFPTAGITTYELAVVNMVSATVNDDGSYNANLIGYVYMYAEDASHNPVSSGGGFSFLCWAAFTGEVASKNGFYGCKAELSTGNPNPYVPYTGTVQSAPPDYNSTALISNMQNLVPTITYPALSYNLNGVWARESNPTNVATLWSQYAQ
jgi:hypothetical protein